MRMPMNQLQLVYWNVKRASKTALMSWGDVGFLSMEHLKDSMIEREGSLVGDDP